ncbi:MAG: terminase family protein [Pseudomonadota bacterium]
MSAIDTHLHKFLGGLAVSLDPVARFRAAMGVDPRPFQRELLTSTASHVILMASRQLGKSTCLAGVAWDGFLRGLTVVLITPHEKQAKEFLLRVKDFRDADPFAPSGIQFLKTEVSAGDHHKGRILAMPATDSARGFTADVLILDEAAQIGDDDIAAVLPMRKKVTGRLLVTSTPLWKDGDFYRWWTEPNDFQEILGHYRACGDSTLIEAIERERSVISNQRFLREYECQFAGGGEPLVSHDTLARAFLNEETALCLK